MIDELKEQVDAMERNVKNLQDPKSRSKPTLPRFRSLISHA